MDKTETVCQIQDALSAREGHPMSEGQTISLKHADCERGRPDWKPRLYVTRKPMHTYVYYCHNCGEHGKVMGVRSFAPLAMPDPPYPLMHTTSESPLYLPAMLQPIGFGVSPQIATYVQKYGINHSVAHSLHLRATCDKVPKLYIPYYADGVEVLYQLRTIDPKEVQTFTSHPQYVDPWRYSHNVDKTIVVTEDALSAIKIMQTAPRISTWPARGCSATNALLERSLKEHYTKEEAGILIWYDNDTETVRENAREMASTLIRKGWNATITMAAEAKSLTEMEIRETLLRAYNSLKEQAKRRQGGTG